MTDTAVPTNDDLPTYFKFLTLTNPPALRVWGAATERDFCSAVEDAIDHAIRHVEEGSQQYQVLPELGLSLLLAQLLVAGGIPSVSEGYHNGHVDITIKHPADKFGKILGECKIYNGPKYHCKGCGQLIKRYHAGRSIRGFCLEFFLEDNMYRKLGNLRQACDRKREKCQHGKSHTHTIKGAYVTTISHSAGSTVEVLHLGCNLHRAD